MDGQEIKTVLGRNIKLIRLQRTYSQADLAEKADISITFLSNIERGNKYPKPAVLSQIAGALEIEVYELFKINSEQKIKPVLVSNKNNIMLSRLSKVMTKKVNSTMEGVFKNFMK